jgi:hypothetical protein
MRTTSEGLLSGGAAARREASKRAAADAQPLREGPRGHLALILKTATCAAPDPPTAAGGNAHP